MAYLEIAEAGGGTAGVRGRRLLLSLAAWELPYHDVAKLSQQINAGTYLWDMAHIFMQPATLLWHRLLGFGESAEESQKHINSSPRGRDRRNPLYAPPLERTCPAQGAALDPYDWNGAWATFAGMGECRPGVSDKRRDGRD
ncbi:MAG TPA: hypothetical protein VGI78_13150 [Acetobacteraceae bacterium]